MTQAVAVRKHGDDFQARVFWLYAAQLLDAKGAVARVAYETGPKAFDDVLVEYAAARGPQDHTGHHVVRDHLQCKWHVRPDEFGYADLVDPSFSNAQTFSFLQRARYAQQQYAPDGLGLRFKLVTNWRLRRNDPLALIVLMQSQALDLARFFDGTTDASAMGAVRKLWREHLGIDEDALRLVARTLGVTLRLDSAEELRDRLNDRFAAVGLIRIPVSEASFIYDDLIGKLHAQGRNDFDRDSFRAMCEQEKLFANDRERNPVTVGVRSFMHPIDDLEARCDQTLNLVPHFDRRFIRDEKAWDHTLFPDLRAFILSAARANDHLRIILDTHVSLAFGVGSILDVKSGKTVEIEQRTAGRRFWSATDLPEDPNWPRFFMEIEMIGSGAERAVAVSLTHDVSNDVRKYVKTNPAIGSIIHFRLISGTSRQSVQCGRHAQILADAFLAELRKAGTGLVTHIFIAGPNAFAFFLGQNQPAIGPVVIYEWDFEGTRDATYRPGLRLPQAGADAAHRAA
jgi:hypothetical protein